MFKVEIRSDGIHLDGYVNAVDRDSRLLPSAEGSFIERISPGTFKEALERAENVDLLVDHSRKIGSTQENNLKLFEDTIGLRAQCIVNDSEVIQKAKEKKLRGWSFGFIARNQRAEKTASGTNRRIIDKLDLLEVSIIDDKMIPCYAGTSIEERAEQEEYIEMRANFEDGEYTESIKDITKQSNKKVEDADLYKKQIEIYRLRSQI